MLAAKKIFTDAGVEVSGGITTTVLVGAILAVAGLILAVLILTVGFWKTVLLLALVAVFALAGAALDRDGGESARNFLQNLFHKDGKQGK